MARTVNPTPQFFDSAGDPLVNGKLYFYMSGTSTDLTTYADVNLTIPNTQPLVLTADGRIPNAFFSGLARVVLTDKDDVQIWDRDPVGEGAIAGSIANWSSIVTYDNSDIVRGSDDSLYQSIQNGNINKDPVSNSDYWAEIRFVNVWNSFVTYSIDDIAQRGGFFYRSKTNDNMGNDPDGDTVNWGGTQSTDIADGSITLVKMEDMSQNEIIGRATVGTGSPQHLTAAQVRTILNVADGATANSTDAFLLARANHTGTQLMSTVSDAGALATLDDITLSLVTDSGALAALDTVGTSEIDALAVDTGQMADDAVTLDKMAGGTAGELISYDASGDPAAVGVGVASQVLTSNGPGLPPSMQDAAPAIILQQVYTSSNTLTTINTAIPRDDTVPTSSEGTQILSTAITPATTSSKILISVDIPVLGGNATVANDAGVCSVFRGTTCIGVGVTWQPDSNEDQMPPLSIQIEDSPASVSSQTYSVRFGRTDGVIYLNGDSTGSRVFGGAARFSMNLMEISS